MPEKIQITLVIDGKTGVLRKATKDSKALGKQLDITKQSAIATSGGFNTLAASLGPLIAGAAIVRFFTDAVAAASQLQETQAKFETVFRQNIQQAEGFASNLVENFNVSEQAAKDYLSTIQDTLVPMGLSRQAAADLSNDVVKLAADLSSFNNVPTATVVRDLQSALVGNTETIKKYGVVLKATDITQRALADSGKKVASELTNAEKVTAAYKLILEGTADAQGDVARTQDSFANRTRKLTSRMEDLKASIGEQLQPVIGDFLQSLSDSIPFLTKVAAVITGLVATGLTGLRVMFSAVQRFINSLTNIVITFAAQIKALLSRNFGEIEGLGADLRKALTDDLIGFVDDTTEANSRLREIATTTKNALLGIEDEKAATIVAKEDETVKKKIALSKTEQEAKKQILDQQLSDVQNNLSADLNQRNLTQEQRIDLINGAEQQEREILNAGRTSKILSEEEFVKKMNGIEVKRGAERQQINNETNEEITRANESWAAKTMNINARVAELGRKTFDRLGDAVGDSFADAVLDGKDFMESMTKLWRNIAKQIISSIISIIIKMLVMKTIQASLGGPFGALFEGGGRTPGMTQRKALRGLAGGGRTNGPETAVIGEGADDESIIPDGQAFGFSLGVLAGKKARLPRGLQKNGLGQLSRGSSSGMSVSFGDINISFTGPMNLDDPDSIDKVLEGMARRFKDKVEVAVRVARLSGDLNEEESDRSV